MVTLPPASSPPPGSCWHTAAGGDSPVTSPMDLLNLQEHLGACHAVRGRLFSLRCGGEVVRGFLGARLMTTLAVGVALVVFVLAWV